VLARFLIVIVRLYQVAISPWTPPACRFTPTCSAYAIGAIERHGALRGGWMALRRIGRCHPFGGHGYDPVPGRHETAASAEQAIEPDRAVTG
jgi:putative membrane protein insertion efficiency factor